MPTLADVAVLPLSESPSDADASFDSLVADGADVARRLAEMPHEPAVTRPVRIPAQAVALVAGLDSYGD